MTSFSPEILLRFPNLNNLHSHVFNILACCCTFHVINSQLFKSFEFGNGSSMPDDNLVILSTFTTFLLSVVDADLYFFSLCDVRGIAVFLLLEHSSLRQVKQKNHLKKHEILAIKPLLQEIQLKIAERFSEALIF